MSIPTNKIRTVVLILIIAVGSAVLGLALSMHQSTPNIKPHQADVEEKQPKPAEQPTPAPEPAEEAKSDKLPLYNNMAADAIFAAFSAATWECYDHASKTYFVYFEGIKEPSPEFGYHPGWNIMGSYTFIVLGNGTATLKSAGNFSPIAFENDGLSCYQRDEK